MSRLNKRSHGPKPIRMNLSPSLRDERVAFVDHVCNLMIDGRYDTERTSRLVVVFSDTPETEEALFYDLTPAGMMPSYPLAEVVDERCSSVAQQRGITLASRLLIRDVALAANGLPPVRPRFTGASP